MYCKNFEIVQGDNSGRRKPLVDFVLALLAAGGPLLQLPTAQANFRNIPNPSQREVVTVQNCHPVLVYRIVNDTGH